MVGKKVILAYSGGLDTSIILHWLAYEQGFEVIAICADVGQEENFNELKKKAKKSGAEKTIVLDKKKELVNIALKAVKSHAIYEGKYLLGTALARIPIVSAQVVIAEKENADYVAHGATAKGNDQIRFELGYNALNKKLKVISPWKNKEFLKKFKNREELKKYAEKNGIFISKENKIYSIDENLLHTSYEGSLLKNSENPSEQFFKIKKNLEEKVIEVNFEDFGVEIIYGEEQYTNEDALKKIKELSEQYLFGIEDIIENRYIGLKSRGIYKQGVMYLLKKAYSYLEGGVLSKATYHKKIELSHEIGKLIYEGKWFEDYTQSLINFSLSNTATGKVGMKITPYNVFPIYSSFEGSKKLKEGDFDMNGFDIESSSGFIKILKAGGG